MKKFKLYFLSLMFGGLALLPLSSCSEDSLGPSIFPENEEELDPTSETYKFDLWLENNYRKPYNIKFLYKMQDVGTNMNYNLVPADYDKAVNLALMVKYLWFDAYRAVADSNFLKANAPRILHVIGSAALSPTSGVETVGLAEGGVKVNLFKVNMLDINKFDELNKYYFGTMHHEFAHILHQKINYPKEFDEITNTKYDATNWTSRGGSEHDGLVNSAGFVTKYASSATREDFAEVVANYITMDSTQWADMMKRASLGWEEYSTMVGTFYCSHYYYNNNQEGDANKLYVYMRRGVYNVDVVEGEDGSLSIYSGGKPMYQTAIGEVTATEIRDAEGTVIEVRYTDSKGNRVMLNEETGQYLAIDDEGNWIPIHAYTVEDTDDVRGDVAIQQKLDIVIRWFRDQWGVDINALRDEVQKRQNEFKADPQGTIARLRSEAGL